MKKILSLIMVTVICLMLTGCTRSITFSTFKDKIDNKETFIVEVIQDGCSHCEEFEPVFSDFTKKYNLEYFQLNLKNVSQNEYNILNSEYTVEGTPTVLLIKKGKLLKDYVISGNVSKDELKKVFTKAKYIK